MTFYIIHFHSVSFSFICGKTITSMTNVLNRLVWLYKTITSTVNRVRIEKFHNSLTFFIFIFFFWFAEHHGGQSLTLSSIFSQSQTFRYLFVVLHLRWLLGSSSTKFINLRKLTISIYFSISCQILLQKFPTDRWWTWTCINCHPITTYETTTQVIRIFHYIKSRPIIWTLIIRTSWRLMFLTSWQTSWLIFNAFRKLKILHFSF